MIDGIRGLSREVKGLTSEVVGLISEVGAEPPEHPLL
jgi:hypothetical protein